MNPKTEIKRLLNDIMTANPYESARKAKQIAELWESLRAGKEAQSTTENETGQPSQKSE
jgi:hypothetical protein